MKINDFNSELELMKDSDNRAEQKAASSTKMPMPEKTEIIEKRGSHSKTFQEKKGKFETIFYNTPVHHYDETEKVFVEINNGMEETVNGFEAAKPDFAAVFHKQEDSRALFTMKHGNYQACVSVKNQFGNQSKRPLPLFEQDHNRVHYANVSPDTDYDCRVSACGVGVSVVKKNAHSQGHSFTLSCTGLHCEWNEQEKTLNLISLEDDEMVFTISAPFMVDANGAYSENVSFEMIPIGDGVCELSVVPDHGWLNSSLRKYPVSVEWSMKCDEPIHNGFVFDAQKISADGKLAVDRTPISFRMHLPEQKNDMITGRVKALFHCGNVPVDGDKVYLLALNRVGVVDEETHPNGKPIATAILREGKSEYAFDVTDEYSQAANTTYSLQLCESREGEIVAADDSAVALMTLSADSAISTFSVEESDGTAEEDSSGGESGNVGSVGNYEIDLASGRVNLEMKDFAWEGNRMPVSITRSYRGLHAEGAYAPLWNAAHTCFQSMRIGNGWRMNLMQSMVDTGYETFNGINRHTYTYTDESGTETLFAQSLDERDLPISGSYEDTDGLGYTYNTATGVLKKGSETHTFASGRLVSVSDEFGNTMHIHYTNGRISSVEDGVGRRFLFAYDGDYLISVTAPNGATVNYQYCNGNLCSTTYPNGQSLQFAYESYSKQVERINIKGNGVTPITKYFETMSGTKKIAEVGTIVGGVRSGKYTRFNYARNKQVIVTEYDKETYEDDSDEDVTCYKVCFLEHSDKNYSYFKTIDGGIEVNEASVLSYSDPGMEINDHKCQNLLKKHNFTTKANALENNVWQTSLTGAMHSFDTTLPSEMPGYRALSLKVYDPNDVEKGIWQTVTLMGGESYVFSCYVKLTKADPGFGKGVYLMAQNEDGTVCHISPYITECGPFVRVAVPFCVEGSGEQICHVGVYLSGNVYAQVIAPQLEQGTRVTPYNYLTSGEPIDLKNVETKLVTSVAVQRSADVRETFTLGGNVHGWMIAIDSEKEFDIQLLARFIYSDGTQEDHWVPLYVSNQPFYQMMQFCKNEYKKVERLEIHAKNANNEMSVYLNDLQLVRNKIETGLSAEDFLSTSTPVDDDDELEGGTQSVQASSSVATDDESENITFEEVLDAFGNTLTGTNFKNGELGAIYTEQKFADSNSDDTIGDAGNNKTSEIDARGNVTRYEYDPVTSKPTKVTDRCGNATSYTYDTAGRTTRVTAPNGGTVSYGYNSYDDLTTITRGDGQSYTMGYDTYRNLNNVKVGSQSLVTYAYKPNTTRLKTMTYANGARQTLTYDRMGNVIGEKWTNGTATEAHYRYFYNPSNQLVKTLDILGKKMYNMNRVGENVTAIEEYDVGEIDATTYAPSGLALVGTMHYSFDSDGKQFRKKYVDADGNEQKYVFEYRDEQNVAVQLPTGVVSHAKSDHLGRKVFDELQLGKGLMNRKFTYHDGEITQTHLDNDKQVSDPQTTLVKQIEFADGRTIAYEYDAEERITKVVDSVDGTYEYTYDALGQLLTEKKNNVTVNTMTYDNYGNIKTKNGKTYTYDATWKDKLLSTGDGSIGNYDLNGNPQSYLGNTLVWEKGRQLKQYGANTYKYNNEGIRIRKQTSTEIHEYILDGTNIVKEIVTDICNCPKYVNEYLYDLDGTVCGLKHNGIAYYFYKNLQGDVIAITDDTGVVVARYAYDACGKCTIVSDDSDVGIATINPFRYRSYYYDTEIGLYYLQSRYYDATLGRFVNADTTNYLDSFIAPNSSDLFSYCFNDFVNKDDPDGDAPFLGWGLQLEGSFMGLSGGIELIWFKNIAKNMYGNRNLPCVYCYGGLSYNFKGENVWNIKSLISFVKDEALRAFSSKRKAAWKIGGGLSLCAFMIYGKITSPEGYKGPFITIGGTLFHVKGYVSTAPNGSVRSYGIGVSSSKFGFSPISASYYLLIPGNVIISIANWFSSLFNKVKTISALA